MILVPNHKMKKAEVRAFYRRIKDHINSVIFITNKINDLLSRRHCADSTILGFADMIHSFYNIFIDNFQDDGAFIDERDAILEKVKIKDFNTLSTLIPLLLSQYEDAEIDPAYLE